MNKVGTEKILAIYWFAVLFIVAAAVVYMAVAFYGKPYDVRDIEVNLLINQVVDCMVDAGYYNGKNLNLCNLNFDVEKFEEWSSEKGKEEYYVEVSVCGFELEKGVVGCDDPVPIGNSILKQDCEIQNGGNFSVCLEKSVYTIEKGGAQKIIKIFAGVRKTEKNVQ